MYFDCFRNPEGAKNYSLSQSQMCVRRMRKRRKVSSIKVHQVPGIMNDKTQLLS